MSSTTVNLDAMILRADFASSDQKPAQSSERFEKIALKDLVGEGAWLPKLLRKPDFQRETTQWRPQQVSMFIESFLDGELIPAVILWQSATHIFVIDGGHRLSAPTATYMVHTASNLTSIWLEQGQEHEWTASAANGVDRQLRRRKRPPS